MLPHPSISTLLISPLVRQVHGRHVAIAIPRSTEVEVRPVDLRLGGAGGVQGGAGVAVQEHVIPGWLAGLNGGRLRHGVATTSGARQQSGTALPVPEPIGAGRRRVLLDPVMAMAQQFPPPPAAKGGAADREAAAEGGGFHPGLVLGIELVLAHGCLPSASSQRCRCQSRCERRQPGFLGTRWRPGLSRPLRLIANSVERLIASWAQSSSEVSQGFEGDMAAGAAGVGAAGEATQGRRGLYLCDPWRVCGVSKPCR